MSKNDDDGPLPAEDVRLAYPELTRCDHCNILDPSTMRVAIDGGMFWLHRHCLDAFEPTNSRPVTMGNHVVGFVAKYPHHPGWTAWRLAGGRLRDLGAFHTPDQAEQQVSLSQYVAKVPGWFIRQWVRL